MLREAHSSFSFCKNVRAALCPEKKLTMQVELLCLWVRKSPCVPITGHPSTEWWKEQSPEHGAAGPVKPDGTSLNV